MAITFAQFLAAVVGFLMRPSWRWMLGGISILSTGYLIGMLFLPESPRWLGKEGHHESQLNVLRMIYKAAHIDKANKELTEEVKKLKETQLSLRLQLKSLFSVYKRPTIISVSLLGL